MNSLKYWKMKKKILESQGHVSPKKWEPGDLKVSHRHKTHP